MIGKYSRQYFGLFEGLPYGMCTEHIEDYKRNDCILDRESVLNHMQSLMGAYTSEPTYDLFTGEQFLAGLYNDGIFTFTSDFLRYYKKGIVDIPKEYEDYLINDLHVA